MKRVTPLITIFLLLLGQGYIITSPIGPSYSVIGNDTESYSFLDQNTPEILHNTDRLSDKQDFVLFLSSSYDYHQFLGKYNVVNAYDNLYAVKITSDDLSDINYSAFSFDSIQPANQYSNMKLHDLSVDNLISDIVNINGLFLEGFDGSGVIVGVLDNGIDFSNPLLQGKKNGSYFAGIENNPSCGTHGTPVSGLISGSVSGEFRGMAPSSQLYDVAFSCSSGSIDGDFLAAFDHMIANNDTISIINTSFGGFAPSWDPVIKRVVESGIVVVGSAGNSGPGLHTTSTGGPGNSIHGISVGAISLSENIASFSSSGPAFEMTFKPDLLAPGISISSTNAEGGLSSYSGTSFSSPIVAGGIASLIEALNFHNISYNPGLIKAALLETAKSIGLSSLRQGQGIVQFQDALNLILNQNSTSPKLVNIWPKTSPIRYHDYFPRGMNISLPLSLVTSNPENVQVSFSGDLSGKEINYEVVNSLSQKLNIVIDSTQFSTNQMVQGGITVTVGNYSSSADLSFTVGENVIGTIGIDRYHTHWDQIGANHIGGSNIGEMIYLALQQNYRVIEIEEDLNSVVLDEIDILWMPDPLNLVNDTSLFEQGFREGSLTNSEMVLLDNFVSSGKSIFVSTLGLEANNAKTLVTGLDTSVFNNYFGKYGIYAEKIPVVLEAPRIMPLLNTSSLVGSLDAITHVGNSLDLQGNAWSLAGIGDYSTLAYYQDETSLGKILVSSTNFWMDNYALKNGYLSGADDKQLASNLWNWLMDSTQIIKLSDEVINAEIKGSFTIPGSLPSNQLQMNAREIINSETNVIPVEWTQDGSVYSFSHPIDEEGEYQVVAEVGDEYIGWHYLRDLTGPSIIPESSNANNSNFEDKKFLTFSFTVDDNIAGIDKSSLILQMNGVTLQEPSDVVSSFNSFQDRLQITIDTEKLNLTRQTYHVLTIYLSDNSGNTNKIFFQFSIGGRPEVETPTPIASGSSDGAFLTYRFFSSIVLMAVIVVCLKRRNDYRFY